MNHLYAMALVAAGMNIPLALTVWSMLHRRCPRRPLALWVGGVLAFGVGVLLYVAAEVWPTRGMAELGAALLSAGPALRIVALRLDLGWSARGGLLASLAAADVAAYLLSQRQLPPVWQVLLGMATMAAWAVALAWHAAQVGRRQGSRSGRVMAAAEALFAAALLLHVVAMAGGWSAVDVLGDSWTALALVLSGLLVAVYGNLGYLGMVLDRVSAAARDAQASQLAEAARREAAERHAVTLRGLLDQREALFHMLAHEIRQPLHNASGAMQAARSVAASPQSAAPVQRAQDVLLTVQSVLDNTLAAATLLARAEPPMLLETDLDFLLQLSLGDLPEAQRHRVLQGRAGPARSAELAPGLVRLALRNLLRNAFQHGGPAVQVWLEVAEQAEPPCLLLRVLDDGPGATAAQLADPGPAAAGAPDALLVARRGLAIVRQVMHLHGGELRFAARPGGGLVAELRFPQPG